MISGDVSKPISVYAVNATTWKKPIEYKVGMQININTIGFSYSTNILESNITFSGKNSSIDVIVGANKLGYTYKTGVNFKDRTADYYSHEYIRTIPTALAVAVTVVACYYTGGVAGYIIGAIGAGACYA